MVPVGVANRLKINDDKALAVKDTIRDLNKEIYELSRQKIDNLIEDYESFNEYTQAAYENASKLNEVYTKRIGRGNKNNLAQMAKQQNNLYVEYAHAYKRIQDEMNAQLANGTMKKNSEAYRKARTDLVNLKNAMLDVEMEIYNINEAIREINWKNWENALKMLEHVDSQIGSTIDLISNLNNYNEDNARITDAGIAKYDLYSSALANARQKVANLNKAITTLDKEYKEGIINEQEYTEQMQEYRQQQMAAAGEVKKHRDAIISLIKEGIEAETKAMEKLTDARKEALKKQKEADDYARSVSDKTTEINKIRAKIAAMAGDDTMATQAKVAKLREELANKEEDLAKTRQDHEYDEMVKSLDDGLEAFKETQDEKTRALSDSLANQEAAIENSLSWTTTQYKTTYDELTEISRSFGIDLEDFLTKPWKSATAAAKTFEEATTKAMKSNAGISTTGYQTIDKNKAADKTGSISAGNSYVESMSNPTTEQKKTNKSKTGGNNATSGKKIAGSFSGASLWFGNTNKVSDVKYLQQLLNAIMGTNMTVDGVFGPKTEAAVKAFQSKYGIGADGVFGNKSRAKMLEVAKKLGYARRGKRNARGLYITDEQGLGSEAIITKEGVLRQLDSDTVFSKKQTEALWNISKMSLDNAMKVSSRGANVNITYGSLLTVTGDVTKDALPGLEEILKKACEYTKRDITASMSKLGFR